jgi:hypothetical protein
MGNRTISAHPTSIRIFEQFLEGEEFSLMTFINGDYAVPFDCIAQDHKRLLLQEIVQRQLFHLLVDIALLPLQLLHLVY